MQIRYPPQDPAHDEVGKKNGKRLPVTELAVVAVVSQKFKAGKWRKKQTLAR
jgi:hypothetical protein